MYENTLNIKEGDQPRHQLAQHLATFVRQADGDNALMIVYYAGHGTPSLKGSDVYLHR